MENLTRMTGVIIKVVTNDDHPLKSYAFVEATDKDGTTETFWLSAREARIWIGDKLRWPGRCGVPTLLVGDIVCFSPKEKLDSSLPYRIASLWVHSDRELEHLRAQKEAAAAKNQRLQSFLAESQALEDERRKEQEEHAAVVEKMRNGLAAAVQAFSRQVLKANHSVGPDNRDRQESAAAFVSRRRRNPNPPEISEQVWKSLHAS